MTLRIARNERGDTMLPLLVSLNMIMLALFIAMASVAVVDEHRKRIAWGSFLGTLGMFTGGLSPSASDKGRGLSPELVQLQHERTTLNYLLKRLEEFSIKEGLAGQSGIMETRTGAYAYLSNEAAFVPGGALLTPQAMELLRIGAEAAAKTGGTLTIEGHTAIGEYANSLYKTDEALSRARAGAGARWLIDQNILPPERISVSGYGALRPITDEETAEKRRLNNRLGMKITLPNL